MSLRTLFKTAAYCSPTIAGLSAVFMAGGAGAPLAAFMGGAAVYSGLLYYRAARYFQDHLPTPVEAPQRLQNIYYKFTQKSRYEANGIYIIKDKGNTDTARLDNAYAYVDAGVIMLGEPLFKRAEPEETEFLIGHEMGHIFHPDSSTQRHARTVSGLMTLGAPVSFFSFLLPGQVDSEAVVMLSASTAAVQFLLSRHLDRKIEYDCDRFAIENSAKPEAAISMLWKLQGKRSLLTRVFSALSTHPPIQDRIDVIAKDNGLDQADVMNLTYFNEATLQRFIGAQAFLKLISQDPS